MGGKRYFSEMVSLIKGYMYVPQEEPQLHTGTMYQGPVPVGGSCTKESFRIYGEDSDLEVFSPKLLTV